MEFLSISLIKSVMMGSGGGVVGAKSPVHNSSKFLVNFN